MNTTQLSGTTAHGYLYCSYDFSKTPEQTACSYHEAKGTAAGFDIAWATAGSYLTADYNASYQASTQTGLAALGAYSSVSIGPGPSPLNWRSFLRLDWRDFGKATVLYGKFTYAATTRYGVVVRFPSNVAVVDPSIVQGTSGYSSSSSVSCTYGSNVSSGDLLVVSLGSTGTVAFSSDSLSLSWSHFSLENTLGPPWDTWSYVYYAKATSGGAETVSFTNNGLTFINCYEISGVLPVVDSHSTGTSTNYQNAPSFSVANYFASTSDFIFASGFQDALNNCVSPDFTAGAGYTMTSVDNCRSSMGALRDEYVSSWVGGATTSSMTSNENSVGSNAGQEISVAFEVPGEVPQPFPSVVQSTGGFSSSSSVSCTYGSNVSSGDLLVVSLGGGGTESFSSDTRSLSWSHYSLENTLGGGSLWSYVYYAQATSGGSETVSFTVTGYGQTFINCYEISGVLPVVDSESTGTSTGYQTPPSFSVSSYSPPSGDFVFASGFQDVLNNCNTAQHDFTAVTGYAYSGIDNCRPSGSGSGTLGDEYVQIWGGGATTSGMTSNENSVGTNWGQEISVAFNQGVAQPFTTTLSGSGSTQTISASGCDASPGTLAGDGTLHYVAATATCIVTLTTPPGYAWQGDGSTANFQTCASGTCPGYSRNYVVTVTQPFNATMQGGGHAQMITMTGCGPNPTSFNGSNRQYNIILDASCSATLSLPSGYTWMGNGTSLNAPNTCVFGLCGTIFHFTYMKSTPLIAGYVTGSLLRENAVQTTVTFKGTPQSDIGTGNDMAVGMMVTGFSKTVGGQDYGFRAEAVLGSNAQYLWAQVIQTCEGHLVNAIPGHCGALPTVKQIYSATYSPSFGASDNVTLEMKWSGGAVYWYFTINGGTNSTFTSYTMPTDANPYFGVGTLQSWGHLAKYFEFGVESVSNLGNTGWKAGVYNPKYYNGSSGWVSVAQANSVMGSNAWLDNGVVWGGQDYTGVSVCYYDNAVCPLPSGYLIFSSAATSVTDGTRLWG